MTLLDKRPNETELEYHKRLVYGKQTDKSLQDVPFAEIGERIYGKRYAEDHARKMIYGSRKTLEIIEEDEITRACAEDGRDPADEIFELKKERQKIFDERAALNKIVRERARQEEINDIIVRAIESADLPMLLHDRADFDADSNDLLVSFNDMHYGVDINNAWTKYNPEICAKMVDRYLERILRIADTHASENCYVFNNGDTISGNIHRTIQMANKENVVNQVIGASELISQFLATLSNNFENVTYVSVGGNHSRLQSKDDAPIDERLDDLVPWYLKARLADFSNVSINSGEHVNMIDDTMYLLDVRGKIYCGVHGDYDINGRNFSGNILKLQAMSGMPLYGVLLGHIHRNYTDEVQGIKTIMAGSFQGTDNYCISKRIYSRPKQMVCVCDSEGVRCHYDIPLDT